MLETTDSHVIQTTKHEWLQSSTGTEREDFHDNPDVWESYENHIENENRKHTCTSYESNGGIL